MKIQLLSESSTNTIDICRVFMKISTEGCGNTTGVPFDIRSNFSTSLHKQLAVAPAGALVGGFFIEVL